MEGGVPRGTVTALSSIFPVGEAEKAAKRVEEAITERKEELGHLQRFVTDNTNLISLVQKLPDELSHPVMVPFGKAAFFPGRLIHTNEFLVLLGEGYYAERTAKQTNEILRRRGKSLESQIESLKAMMQDLQAEASFFNATASEAADDLVEIREEYIEEPSTEEKSESVLPRPNSVDYSQSDGAKVIREDEEYARIMARLDELEKEEEEAFNRDEDDDSESDHGFNDHQLNESIEKLMSGQLSTSTKNSLSRSDSEPDQTKPSFASKLEDPKSDAVGQALKSRADHGKAFTGSIVEHSHGIPSNPPAPSLPSSSKVAPGSSPSKPVSRFKMQKGNR